MDSDLKKALRAISLELRHTLEGTYDERGGFQPGDLERRLNAIGVWRDREAKPLSELAHLPDEDKAARQIIDAYLGFRAEAGVGQAEAVAEFVRESAYNWANRLLTLRCMEARGIIDEVILQKEVYGRRSMVHNRLGQRDPALLAQADEGLFTVLLAEFGQRARELPTLFNPKAPAIALRPSLAALKKCIGLLSGTVKAGSYEADGDALFAAPDALGWAYQYWNAEEKDRVFEKVRTEKGAKIAGADIIPATQLYTEPYMVKFLVQNSLGALWLGMNPDSDLAEGWEYYVRDADRAPVAQKSVRDITFLDPACGSGHFHLEAFDLLYAMYEAEAAHSPEEICAAILNHNLYGIDIDERATQIAQAALWMKAKEVAWELEPEALTGFHHHFVATNIKLPQGINHLEAFLRKHPEDLPLRPALETVFEGLENAHELGSLLQLEEPVEKELRFLQGKQAEVAQTLQQGELFAELAQPRQGALPLGVDSYDAWKAKTLAQLGTHFDAEAEAADLTQAFFGQSAGKGLALFDILARRYDVVAANPPYMHNSNFGPTLKSYIYTYYPSTMQDLYAAFVARIISMSGKNGIATFVTQHSFMFLERHLGLREFLFSETSPEILVHLGPKAFSEIGGEIVNVILLVLRHSSNVMQHGTFYDLTTSDNKVSDLLDMCANNKRIKRWRKNWQDFQLVPGNPIVYHLEPEIIEQFSFECVEDISIVSAGMVTGNNARYVRFWWEAPSSWTPYMKGGESLAWYGNNNFSIDASTSGFIRMRSSRTFRAAGEEFYGRRGITYSSVSALMRARYMVAGAIWDCGGTAIIPEVDEDIYWLLGIMNSTYASRILYAINPTINIKTNDVKRLPVCDINSRKQIELIAKRGVEISVIQEEQSVTARDFLALNKPSEVGDLRSTLRKVLADSLFFQLGLFSIQDNLDEEVLRGYKLSKERFPEFTRLASTFPSIAKYDKPAKLNLESQVEPIFTHHHTRQDVVLDTQNYSQLVQMHFEQDSGVSSLDINNPTDNDAEETYITVDSSPIPAETLLEKISLAVHIHPISVYWLLKEGIEQEGWRCPSEEKRLTEDRFTVTVLRLLGHCWPTQIEAGESIPSWSEPSGIIPITNNSPNQATLYDRVRDRLTADFPNSNPSSIEREFADIVGEKLSDWLAGSFFSRHISQFKKRPIAWQLQTSAAPGQRQRGGPAFAALLYYHKLSADLLPTLRNQTIRDLIRAYETEQRTLRQSQDRSSEQETRLHQLETWLTELQTFSDALQHVSDHGFGDTPALQTTLRQYALDDAMQSLKATWLRRLADKAATDALTDWQTRADKTDIHPALRDWIATATANLHHHCAQVGAPAPKATKLKTDPDARALAVIIGSQAKKMASQALHLSGDAWFTELTEHVLQPLLDEINALKAQQAALETERDALDPQDTRGHYTAEQAIKSLKSQIRTKTKERNAHRKAANELREHIESWQCPAAVGWTDWLGQQPLFDPFASLDGQRQPPQTIADFVAQESRYAPDINDGVRVNIAPLQKAGLLATDVLAAKDINKAIADRAEWRADERRWCREGKLPRPGWWV